MQRGFWLPPRASPPVGFLSLGRPRSLADAGEQRQADSEPTTAPVKRKMSWPNSARSLCAAGAVLRRLVLVVSGLCVSRWWSWIADSISTHVMHADL
jgi:hypothetical protein